MQGITINTRARKMQWCSYLLARSPAATKKSYGRPKAPSGSTVWATKAWAACLHSFSIFRHFGCGNWDILCNSETHLDLNYYHSHVLIQIFLWPSAQQHNSIPNHNSSNLNLGITRFNYNYTYKVIQEDG